MKIADRISKSIIEYPTLYKSDSYENSKLKVLNHLFFVIGNGYDFAETENPNEGGYLVKPIYREDFETGDWIRVLDKPYGEETYEEFSNILSKGLSNNFSGFAPSHIGDCSKVLRVYEGEFLQEDWLKELIFLCQKSLEYFNDENQYKNHNKYPSVDLVSMDLRHFQQTFKKGGFQGLNDLQKSWGYEVKNVLPSVEEIETRIKENWAKFHKGQIDFLTAFLAKFK